MATEQDRTLDALQIAIQMEIDGQEYYLNASQQSGNELGKKLLESLASEEDYHRQKFEEIYSTIKDKKAWPAIDFQPDGGRRLRTIFARATEETGSSVKAPATELDAVQTAMDLENKRFLTGFQENGNILSQKAIVRMVDSEAGMERKLWQIETEKRVHTVLPCLCLQPLSPATQDNPGTCHRLLKIVDHCPCQEDPSFS